MKRPKQVLVIDVGGTHVKVLATGHRKKREFESGPKLGPREMVAHVRELTRDWRFDAVSIGYPGPAHGGRPVADPHNLGPGWVRFDFRRAFAKPVHLMNDAAMQALGSYEGGRMLFLGLGTGMGSALVVDGVVEPLELAHLPYKNGKTFEDYVGERGLVRLGWHHWHRAVHDVVDRLAAAMQVEYVVLGGGNARLVKRLPKHTRRGDNHNAFRGGYRLWETR
ncbi:MAG TPA: ROK family protein [Myxococcota bacterium]|nr:ROK family protein [Myxococcota bacterium]